MRGRGGGPSETSVRGCRVDGALDAGESWRRAGRVRRPSRRGRRGRSRPPRPRRATRTLRRARPRDVLLHRIRGSPDLTVCPASTRTSETVPAFWERTSLSIFIASRMHTGSSASTSCPSSTSTLTMVPCIGAGIAPPLAEALRVSPRLRRGGPTALAFLIPEHPHPEELAVHLDLDLAGALLGGRGRLAGGSDGCISRLSIRSAMKPVV